MIRSILVTGAIIAWASTITSAVACPAIGRLADFNCDGKAHITVIGDSLVYGFGDTKNNNSGGYILRAQAALPETTISNQGILGLRTLTLIKKLSKAFKNEASALRQDLLASDVVVLDLGRNDRWLFGLPAETFRNLKRARAIIEKGVAEATGFSPLVVTAVLMYPNRGSQGPWVKELDDIIFQSDSTKAPANLRFDQVSKRLLSADNIHPTSKGYAALASVFVKYLLREYGRLASALRPDEDGDGLYDMFERLRYGTDPTNPDSDGDGVKDGEDASPLG